MLIDYSDGLQRSAGRPHDAGPSEFRCQAPDVAQLAIKQFLPSASFL